MLDLPVLVAHSNGWERHRGSVTQICGRGDGILAVVDHDAHDGHGGVVHEDGEDDQPEEGAESGPSFGGVVQTGYGAVLPKCGKDTPDNPEKAHITYDKQDLPSLGILGNNSCTGESINFRAPFLYIFYKPRKVFIKIVESFNLFYKRFENFAFFLLKK